MISVGITGGIGSGKTLICHMFEILGAPVYYADQAAKELIVEKLELKTAIIELLGEQAYSTDGKYNTKYVSELVFSKPELLRKLNELVHPAVKQHSLQWLQDKRNLGLPYCLKEAALLFESGANEDLDYIIYIKSPLALRILRIKERDKLSEADIKKRVIAQWPDEKKENLSDFIIINDASHALIPQVFSLHQKLIKINQTSVASINQNSECSEGTI